MQDATKHMGAMHTRADDQDEGQVKEANGIAVGKEMQECCERDTEEGSGKATAKELMLLLKRQGERCGYSGIKLTPQAASLDHKTPVSDGGDDMIGNLLWVDARVNRMKGAMTSEEFVKLCCMIAEKQGYIAPAIGGT